MNQDFLEECPIPGREQGKYQMNLGHLIVPESQCTQILMCIYQKETEVSLKGLPWAKSGAK